jgi:hypothetical protein
MQQPIYLIMLYKGELRHGEEKLPGESEMG